MDDSLLYALSMLSDPSPIGNKVKSLMLWFQTSSAENVTQRVVVAVTTTILQEEPEVTNALVPVWLELGRWASRVAFPLRFPAELRFIMPMIDSALHQKYVKDGDDKNDLGRWLTDHWSILALIMDMRIVNTILAATSDWTSVHKWIKKIRSETDTGHAVFKKSEKLAIEAWLREHIKQEVDKHLLDGKMMRRVDLMEIVKDANASIGKMELKDLPARPRRGVPVWPHGL